MTEQNKDDSQVSLTQEEADTLELLDNGARVLHRATGWVIHLKGYSYGLGGERMINSLTERGFLENEKTTEAGREALKRLYPELPSWRWKGKFQ